MGELGVSLDGAHAQQAGAGAQRGTRDREGHLDGSRSHGQLLGVTGGGESRKGRLEVVGRCGQGGQRLVPVTRPSDPRGVLHRS